MVEFKVGDEVEMLDSCSKQEKGSRIILTEGNGQVWAGDYYNGSACNCEHLWKKIKGANMKYELGQKLKNNFGDTRENN